MEFQLDVADLE